MESLINPTAYVDRHLEPLCVDINEEEVYEREGAWAINRPLGEVTFHDAGEVELHADNVVVYYEYCPVSSVPVAKGDNVRLGSPDEWRDVVNLIFYNEANGEAVELNTLYPNEYQTTFRVADGGGWHKSYHDYDSRRVVMGGRLLAPKEFYGLFHDVGHALDKEAHPFLYEPGFQAVWDTNPSDPLAQSLALAKERNAWAFALKTLKPFLSPDPNSAFSAHAVQSFIHHVCLQAYTNKIKKAQGHIKDYHVYNGGQEQEIRLMQ